MNALGHEHGEPARHADDLRETLVGVALVGIMAVLAYLGLVLLPSI